jgi:hypothetical protein
LAFNWSMNGRRKFSCCSGRLPRFLGLRRPVAALVVAGLLSVPGSAALYAQNSGELRFANNTPFVVHIVAGSGRTEVCTINPRGTGTGRGNFGTAEYFYPVFDVPLTATFLLRDLRPADSNFFYQIDDRASRRTVVIDAAPPLNDSASYLVLVNGSRTGGVSVGRAASSRMSRIDAGGSDNVNAGESGVYRINPRDNNDMRIISPVNVAFPAVVYRPGFLYAFAFDGTEIGLIDARPLHGVGQPVNAALALDGAIPEAEGDSIRGALEEALAANRVLLRLAPQADGTGTGEADAGEAGTPEREGGEHEAGEAGTGGDLRYEFTVSLTMDRQTRPLAGWALLGGELAISLSRNGAVVAQVKAPVTEFDESGLYRALRRFILNEQQFYRRVAEAMSY